MQRGFCGKKSDELNVRGSFVLVRVCLGMCVGRYVFRYLCLRKNAEWGYFMDIYIARWRDQ